MHIGENPIGIFFHFEIWEKNPMGEKSNGIVKKMV